MTGTETAQAETNGSGQHQAVSGPAGPPEAVERRSGRKLRDGLRRVAIRYPRDETDPPDPDRAWYVVREADGGGRPDGVVAHVHVNGALVAAGRIRRTADGTGYQAEEWNGRRIGGGPAPDFGEAVRAFVTAWHACGYVGAKQSAAEERERAAATMERFFAGGAEAAARA